MTKKHFLVNPEAVNADNQASSSLSRRSFIKRTGGATVCTLVAWNLSTAKSRAENPNNTTRPSGSRPKKTVWKCKLVIAGPKSTPYSEEALSTINLNETMGQNRWGEAPTGPPQGGHALDPDNNDGKVVAYWSPPSDANIGLWKTRDPETPVVENWYSPSGQYYAAYLYDYIEEEYIIEPASP